MFSKLVSVVALAAAVVAVPAASVSSTCDRTYTVVAGDNCDTIGNAQHVSFYQLHFVNPIINSDCTNLFVGQVLCLGETGQDCTATTVIQSGNTCQSIEASAGISMATLLHNNPQVNSDCSNIRPSEVLCTYFQNYTYSIQEPSS